MPRRPDSDFVFINCPFDAGYKLIFHGIVFAVSDLGLAPRCALEADDAGEFRLAKIERIIDECRFGIHDPSAVGLDPAIQLPRFNMPLELGLFLGCRRFGDQRRKKKQCMILDADRYRYRNFISDISGQDIHAHGGEPRQAIVEVRNWLAVASGRRGLPGGSEIASRYERFQADLPTLCAQFRRKPDELIFADVSELIHVWVEANA